MANKKIVPSNLRQQEAPTQEASTDDKPSENFTHDLAQVRNIKVFLNMMGRLFRQGWLSPLYIQGGISFSRSLISAGLIPQLLTPYKSDSTKTIHSAYLEIFSAVTPLQMPLDLLTGSSWVRDAETISFLSQPFSRDRNLSKPPRYVLYLPQLLGASILVSRLNRDFLQFIQEKLNQPDYTDLYGIGLLIGAEAAGRFLGPLIYKKPSEETPYSLPLSQQQIDNPDILQQNLITLRSSDPLILQLTAIFGLFTLVILPQFFSSPQFSSSAFENIDWSFVINLVTAYLIRTFVFNLINTQAPLRESLAKNTSVLLNKQFGRTIKSKVVTSHDFIQITCTETKDPEADKANFSFFIVALGLYCKANVISEGMNQFVFALFQGFDMEVFREKLASRFKIHKQLYRFIQSITTWQHPDKSADFQITLTPFDGGEDLSWSIEMNGFNEPLQIQNRLRQILIESYGEGNEGLNITIQNGELIIHGLQKHQLDNRYLKRKIDELNSAQTVSNTSSAKISYYGDSQHTFYPTRTKSSKVRTGPARIPPSDEKYDDTSTSQKLTADEKWVNIEATAKALCDQARKKLTSSPMLKFKGGDPKQDAFFALIETRNNVPLYIRCVVWAQNLTHDLISQITDNEALRKVLDAILDASEKSGCVVTSSRSHEGGSATGIVKCAASEGYPYKLFVPDSGATRCGIATVEIDKFSLTHPSENGSLTPYRLAIMNTENCFRHQKYDRAAARVR